MQETIMIMKWLIVVSFVTVMDFMRSDIVNWMQLVAGGFFGFFVYKLYDHGFPVNKKKKKKAN